MHNLQDSALGGFAHEITTEMTLPAPLPTVWQAITDFAAYSRWNPFITEIQGEPTTGARLRITLQQPNGTSPMRFSPRILLCEREQELTWQGRFLLPGILTGVHSFRLEHDSDGQTHLVHREVFTGILVPFFKRAMAESTRTGFELMNDALAQEVQRRCQQQ
ncbi:SRPBCC domain-containing protein [Desulfurispirillum indicum]|uniref:Polyketide cyclase/dehydrase n=1 Tax=Desulfurispirillum indicum (strain ATCC BAA-1389 / DSM 22839 / S5) TaxID=653733 RepID=E6W6L1_DESIS|nr:SRPBCC domain-containing protein [Desulfurispirillum indicum]ADU65011.1 Polyketide cyclase/dehydrase [Desulfurispirillum indicum S5]UCZ56914.1 SRPBCC domain-containing protein [Desulfurispirillum indicum]